MVLHGEIPGEDTVGHGEISVKTWCAAGNPAAGREVVSRAGGIGRWNAPGRRTMPRVSDVGALIELPADILSELLSAGSGQSK